MGLSPKRTGMLCHKLVCLSQLLLETLDELNPTTEGALIYKENLTGIIEELNNDISNTETIQSSTYFNDISNKIETIIRKQYNPQM